MILQKLYKSMVIDLMLAFYNGHCKEFKGEHHEKIVNCFRYWP